MSTPAFGGRNEIPQVEERTIGDAFENIIRMYGVAAACEWFGHSYDSEFTAETIKTLRERSGVLEHAVEEPDDPDDGSDDYTFNEKGRPMTRYLPSLPNTAWIAVVGLSYLNLYWRLS